MAYLFLAGAILAEVLGTTALTLSEGFSRLLPSVVVVVGYVLAFVLLAQALVRGIGIGVAYGTWAAAGVALVAAVGVVMFGESLSAVQLGGIGLVILGVLALDLGGAH